MKRALRIKLEVESRFSEARGEELLEIRSFSRREYASDDISVNREEARLLVAWINDWLATPEQAEPEAQQAAAAAN